jgi:FO synthase subunit 2
VNEAEPLSAPGLALALLEHPWPPAHLLLRQRADQLRSRPVGGSVTMSRVKLGLDVAHAALTWGCDDLGGTLMDEHITTMAGALGGPSQTPQALEHAACRFHRPVRQRTTLYGRP